MTLSFEFCKHNILWGNKYTCPQCVDEIVAERDAARAELAPIIALLDPNESSGIPIAQLVKAMQDELEVAREEVIRMNERLHKCDGMAHEINLLTGEVQRLRAFVTAYDRWAVDEYVFGSTFDAMLEARAALDAKEQTK